MLRKLLFVFLLFPSLSFAQTYKGTLVFSSDQGDAFFVFLNGVKQNNGAQSKVTIDGLDLPYYDVRIEFLNSAVQPLEKKNVTVADSDDRPMQVTYKIRKDKSGKAKLNFYAMLPPVYTTTAEVVQSSHIEPEMPQNKPVSADSKTLLTNVSGATVSIPKKDSSAEKKDSSAILNKGIVSKKTEAPVTLKDQKATTSKPLPGPKKQAPLKVTPVAKTPVQAATKPVGEPERPLKKCNDWPMMKEEFQKIKLSVMEVKDETLRLKKAKSMSSDNCLLVSQVSEVAVLFTRETTKLDFVKFAYASTIDRPNFDRLKKLFADQANIRDFEKFLQAR